MIILKIYIHLKMFLSPLNNFADLGINCINDFEYQISSSILIGQSHILDVVLSSNQINPSSPIRFRQSQD